jgi:hypothetical protein
MKAGVGSRRYLREKVKKRDFGSETKLTRTEPFIHFTLGPIHRMFALSPDKKSNENMDVRLVKIQIKSETTGLVGKRRKSSY